MTYQNKTILTLSLTVAIAAVFTFQNCSNVKFGMVNDDNNKPFACDPLGGGSGDGRSGLLGSLYYLNDSQPRYTSVNDYIQYGTPVRANFFFSRINVPTRAFDTGFELQNGDLVKNDRDEDLFEYFAFDFHSKLKLAPGDAPGRYQLALLSDDGSTLALEQSGREILVVDNDGDHNTRFGCGTVPVDMAAASRHPLRLKYYQGPRLHIAAIVMWRPLPATGGSDPACGSGGNELYFDSNSQPKAAYNDLLSRGWSVLKAENFELPDGAPSNPCDQ